MPKIKLDPETLAVDSYETDAAEEMGAGAVPTTTWLSRVTACALC